MSRRSEWLLAIGLSALVAGLTLVPYAVANRVLQPGMAFGGVLINPVDGFSYLAKMREGAQGEWLFRLPYAPDPGPGAILFPYHIFLGHLSRLFGLSLLSTYHGARVAASFIMYLCGFLLFVRLLPDLRTRWTAFLVTLVGSGLGWAAFQFGRMPSDLTIPESIPFFASLANAHFPLATALVLGIAGMMFAGPRKLALRVALAFILGFFLGAVQPFAVIGLALPLACWWIWEVLVHQGAVGNAHSGTRDRTGVLVAAGIGGGIWVAYDYWILRSHPVLAAWTAQNQTLSPPVLDFVIGYAVVLVPAVIGVLNGRPHQSPEGRLLLVWSVVAGLLLYSPVAFQRRLALGLFFPLSALAAIGLDTMADSRRRHVILLMLVILAGLPSNLLVAAAGPAQVARADPQLVFPTSDLDAYRWMENHVEPASLVLAGPHTGNRLPAYADVRVLYGHPFETPGAELALATVESAFSGGMTSDEVKKWLQAQQVRYVFYGPQEQSLGAPQWLTTLTEVFRKGQTAIYRVDTQ